jgi:hypothetical protein
MLMLMIQSAEKRYFACIDLCYLIFGFASSLRSMIEEPLCGQISLSTKLSIRRAFSALKELWI